MTDQPGKRITIDPPDSTTILAARHLDATEGRVQIGTTVDSATRAAISRVLDYIATAHNSPAATAEQERDGAYRERAHLVGLAASFAEQAVIAPAPDVDEPGWQILYATLHGRQCSWHIAPRDADLFEHLDHVDADDPRAQWDGHTTDEKYRHIDWIARALGTAGPFRKD
jgi:hypothetical protein